MLEKRIGTVFISKGTKKKDLYKSLVAAGAAMVLESKLSDRILWYSSGQTIYTVELDQSRHMRILKDFTIFEALKSKIKHLRMLKEGVSVLTPMKESKLIEILDWIQVTYGNEDKKSNTKTGKSI